MRKISLGRMGVDMAKRLLRGNHEVVAYNRSPQKRDARVKEEGGIGAYSLVEQERGIMLKMTHTKPLNATDQYLGL